MANLALAFTKVTVFLRANGAWMVKVPKVGDSLHVAWFLSLTLPNVALKRSQTVSNVALERSLTVTYVALKR
jgi:hypothetical protein